MLTRKEQWGRPESMKLETMDEVEEWEEECGEEGEDPGMDRRFRGMKSKGLPGIIEEVDMDDSLEMEALEEVEVLTSTPTESDSTPLDSSMDSIDDEAPTSTTSSHPDTSPTASTDETDPFDPLSSRPISSLLHIFSYRATVCLSSLELLPDDASVLLSTWKEPTSAEMEVVHDRLKGEVEIVERAIEQAVEDRGVSQDVKGMGGSYFTTMRSSFVNVTVDEEGIDTLLFLDAVESLVVMFGESLRSVWEKSELMDSAEQFASSAFRLVQSDIVENIRVSRSILISKATLTEV